MRHGQPETTDVHRSGKTLLWCVFYLHPLVALGADPGAASPPPDVAHARIGQSVRELAADAMEGRGIGTAGIDRAAEYIAEQFAQIGLQTAILDEAPFQNLTVTTDASLGPAKKKSPPVRASGPLR